MLPCDRAYGLDILLEALTYAEIPVRGARQAFRAIGEAMAAWAQKTPVTGVYQTSMVRSISAGKVAANQEGEKITRKLPNSRPRRLFGSFLANITHSRGGADRW